MIKVDYDKRIIEREVFKASDWLESVGGLMGSVEFIFLFFVPFFNGWSLEKYLVSTLFHRYLENPDANTNQEEFKRMEFNERKLAQVKLSLKERKLIEPSFYPSIIETFRKCLAKCFERLKPSDEDYYFKKAQLRLSKELDIKNFIQGLRTHSNSMKFLTTQAERKFVRMQAYKNVLVLKEGERSFLEMDPGDLSETARNALIGDSSAFTSEDYDAYIDNLGELVKKKHKVLTDREQQLISGVFLKEQEMNNLVKLGLGGLLR